MWTRRVGLRGRGSGASPAFCTALGYEVLGDVPETEFGSLTMLTLSGDDFVGIELVHAPARKKVDVSGLDHVIVRVASMHAPDG